jgi:hypothetical protein
MRDAAAKLIEALESPRTLPFACRPTEVNSTDGAAPSGVSEEAVETAMSICGLDETERKYRRSWFRIVLEAAAPIIRKEQIGSSRDAPPP